MKNKLPYVLTKEQLLSILSVMDDVKTVMVTFLGTFLGLRISEIVKLEWSDIDLIYGECRIRDAKNPNRFKTGYGQDRIVPINEMFLPVLKKWKLMNKEEKFVIPRDGPKITKAEKSMIKRYQDKFHDCLKKVGLDEVDYYQRNERPRYKYHVHTLRHVCGTNLYRAGLDLYQIKEFLGHKEIKTTQIYCELGKDDLKAASHKAYAYPKSRIGVTTESSVLQMAPDKESLKLMNENLKMMLKVKEVAYATQQTI